MLTIKDIAYQAGVAKSTVSNVLTGKKYVSPEIRKKVLEICDKSDYQPNFYASTLSAKTKTNIIGLFLEESQTDKYKIFYSSLIEGILLAISKISNNLLIYSGLNKNETTNKLKTGKSPIDGAIILAPTINDTRISEFNKNLIPFVLIGHPNNQMDVNFVDTDNISLTNTITMQILNKGYDKICLINSNENLVISKERNEGFRKAFNDNSEYNNTVHCIKHSNDSTSLDGYNYSLELIKQGYNAFITASGVVASGVYKACKELGKKIGTEVIIFSLGYSFDQDLSFEPSLSYASQDYFKFGTLAVEKLYSVITGKEKNIKETIDSEFHYHDSFKI